MKAIVTVGLPGCGKSTYAAKRVAAEGLVEVNLDDLRARVAGDAKDQNATVAALYLRDEVLETYAREGRDLIVSDTQSHREHRARIIAQLRQLGYRVELVVFDVGAATCKARNLGRERVVPEGAIDEMAARLQADPPRAEEADAFGIVHEPADPLWAGCVDGRLTERR